MPRTSGGFFGHVRLSKTVHIRLGHPSKKYASADTKSYGLLLVLILLASQLVFLAPLPFFQILFAAALAGVVTSQSNLIRLTRTDFWRVAGVTLMVLGITGIKSTFFKMPSTPAEEPTAPLHPLSRMDSPPCDFYGMII